jgi:hypothetical protein
VSCADPVELYEFANLGLAVSADRTKNMTRVTNLKNISHVRIAGIMVSFIFGPCLDFKLRQGR